MKFLIDADCPRSLAEVIRQSGHEVQDSRDVLPNASDEEIYHWTRREGFILITRDTDFSNLLRFPLTARHGVILLRTLLLAPSSLRKLLEDVLRQIPQSEITGRLVVVRPGRYRIRKF